MSTKEKMLGKESNNKKAHRRYSLLLLALLFIGFATYGTYAYFSNSTETRKGNLTLNGMNGDYQVGGGSGSTADTKTGDGVTHTSDSKNNTEYTPDSSDKGGGTFTPVKDNIDTTGQDESRNSTQFGEFNWVYVGNKSSNIEAPNLLADSLSLTAYNKFVTKKIDNLTSDEGETFGNVVGGDVFRKTVRLKVGGNATVPLTTTLNWAENTTGDAQLNQIIAAVFVKRGKVTENGDAPAFAIDNFAPAITDVAKPADYTNPDISVKPGQYLDIEIVVQVKNNAAVDDNLNLAKIARQLKVTLNQDVTQSGNNGVFGSKTANTTATTTEQK